MENERRAGRDRGPQRGRPSRILLAEDDLAMREMLASVLRGEGYAVTECRDGAELRELLGPHPRMGSEDGYELVLSDIRMPLLNALQVLEGLFPSRSLPSIVLITAFGDAATLERAEMLGSVATFSKPFELDDLLETVHAILGDTGEDAGDETERIGTGERSD
jgi:DNA-binding response OmpR family regulator